MNGITLDEGKELIRFVRRVIEAHFKGEEEKVKNSPPNVDVLKEERGVFVTLKTYPKNELRGCIGYIEGIMPLRRAIPEIAISSAFYDPRFPPVRRNEIKDLVVEISILTKPELIKIKNGPEEYINEIVIGRDGLIVESGVRKGVLLPQVPVEWKWNKEEFLSHTCMKAGLEPSAWRKSKDIKLYKFSAEIFAEKEPMGEVVKIDFMKESQH